MLARFRARAAELHLPLFEVYGEFAEASRLLSSGPDRGGRPRRHRGARQGHPLPRRQRRGRLLRRAVPDRRPPWPAAGSPGRGRGAGGSLPPAAHGADGPRPGARRRRPPRRGAAGGWRTGRCSTGSAGATTRCSCRWPARWSRPSASSATASGRPCCATPSSRTPRESRSAAWPGSRSVPSAGTWDSPPRRAAISTRPNAGCARPSPWTCGSGLRPYEARSRHALAEVLAERGGPGDAEQAAEEQAAAAAIADSIGQALPVRA